jgi:hypothetical protein
VERQTDEREEPQATGRAIPEGPPAGAGALPIADGALIALSSEGN